MSTDRRWDGRRYLIEESATANGGKRTVFIGNMTPGTSVPPHDRTKFSETFDLVSGSMKLHHTDQPDIEVLENLASSLQVGAPKTIVPLLYRKYTVGDEVTTLPATIRPGDLDFKRLLKILDGLARDGQLEKFNDVFLMAIIMELADTHLVRPAKIMLDEVYATRKDEKGERKEELLAKYDTEEALKRLTGNI